MNLKERISEFLKERNISRNRFYGRCIVYDRGCFLVDIVSKEEPIALLKGNGDRLTINVTSLPFKFLDGNFYEFSIFIPEPGVNGKILILLDLKNNPPYLTEVNSALIINNAKTNEPENKLLNYFLTKNNIKNNRFYGICIENETGKNSIYNIISKFEGNLLLRNDGDRFSILVSNSEFKFKTNGYYEFSLANISHFNKKEEILAIDYYTEPPLLLEFDPYKEIIRLRYERLDNPEANRMIAHLMREIGKGLYSSKQRMIFELLQNADDTPAGDEVSFHIDAHYDYFLVMHNGVPFNQDDVEAITSAAESTKRNDKKKTGYKGIGFKSVFTDSEEVIIKSGGFLFAFQRHHVAYNDFDAFYFSKKRYSDYPALLEEDKLKYTKPRRTFNGKSDIPWQLIPIWLDKLPFVFKNSRLVKFNNNVGFAIKFGQEKVNEYLDAVNSFVEKPHFMLFLRHVNVFKSFKNGVTVRKSGDTRVLITKTTQNGDDLKLVYTKYSIETIQVNDIALAEEGIRIFKKEKTNEYGEISHYFSSDKEGNNIIESIPPKLAAFESTSITFAAPVFNNQILCEHSYLDEKAYSCFFTYLPMKETRIQLPFLINADFVPSANREELQGDNQWNEYIISKIAFQHLRWLKFIAQQSIESGIFESEYLSLLLRSPIEDDSSIQLLIDKYNSVYLKSLIEVEFVITDESKLIKLSEVILDKTGIAKLIGSDFFYKLTSTNKQLPHSSINVSYLEYDYLEIDNYDATNLLEDLNDEFNSQLLSKELKILSDSNYLSFLEWLNEFCLSNIIDAEWILTLPFIKYSKGIMPFNEIILVDNLIIKSQKTRIIEPLLIKMGYELSDFFIDDYKYLFEKIWHIDSYLNKDIQLYKLISNNLQNNVLSHSEKGLLLTFIDSLEGVGEAKYANAFAIFKSNKPGGNLKPLNSLISNKCLNIPDWLFDFLIDKSEEDSLSPEFKKYLITESNLLESFFCNPILFDELMSAISEKSLLSFYTYILKLKKNYTDNNLQIFTGIPWVYVPSLRNFQMPSTIYCPDSLLKLSKVKYASVINVIQAISKESLPAFSALPIIEEFALSCKKGLFSSMVEKSATIGLLQLNDFLDWAVKNSEKDLLNNLSFKKKKTEFILKPAPGVLHYYSDDPELIKSIKADGKLKASLNLLPKELYSFERKNIGLMEGLPLLKFLLENGMASLTFAKFIYPLKNDIIKRLYIEKLHTIDLYSNKVYDRNTSEHKALDIILNLGKDDDKFYDSVISKLTIDGHELLEKNISDDVIFKFSETDKMLERNYILKLSEILPTYKDETAALTKVIDNFVDIKSKGTLRKLFKTVAKNTTDIFNEIHALSSEYLTPPQLWFILLFKEGRPNLDFRKGKVDFDEYWFTKDKRQYEVLSTQFLNILFKNNYLYFSPFSFIEFVLSNKIISEPYTLKSEMLPSWVANWLKDDSKKEKLKFLVSAGLNTEDSPIVLLRKGFIERDKDVFEKGLVNLQNSELLKNTIQWLYKYQQENNISFEKVFLKPLFDKIIKNKIISSFIPIINNILSVDYILLPLNNQIFHLLNDTWDSDIEEIYNKIKTSGAFVIDDIIPFSSLAGLNLINVKKISIYDTESLHVNSVLFNEPYYLNCAAKSNYKIFIYNGTELPCVTKYDTIFSRNFSKGKAVLVNKSFYYITSDTKEDLPFPLKGIMPEAIYSDLVKAKSEYERMKNREQYEISYSDEETSALNRLFGDQIPRDFHKDLNLASLIKGLIYLSNNDYDISEAEQKLSESHEYSQLYPVYDKGVEKNLSNALKVKCRSAKSGLLYLRASSWQELKDENTYLYVLTGNDNSNCRFCKTREEVISDKKANFRVLRFETAGGVSDIDNIINGEFDTNSLWLILRMIDKQDFKSIFEKIRNSEANDSISNANMGNESID